MRDLPKPGRCARCFVHQQLCLCAEIPRLENRTHVAILRHARERKKNSNTGRLAAMAIVNSSLHTYGVRERPLDESVLVGAGAHLLFPGGPPLDPAAPPQRLIILDGTWPQARHMRQRIVSLHNLPVAGLPSSGSRSHMRAPPQEEAMATLEAIAVALGVLEGPVIQAALLGLYDLAVTCAAATGRRYGSP